MLVLHPAVHLPALQNLIKHKASILIDRRASSQVDMAAAIGGGGLYGLQMRRVEGAIELDDRRFGRLRSRRALAGMRWDHECRNAWTRGVRETAMLAAERALARVL